MDTALRALNRFGLGARRGERRSLADPRAWLRQQLEGGPPLMRVPEGASPGEIGDALRAFRTVGQRTPEQRRDARRRLVAIGAVENVAALTERLTTPRPFVERLVAFWSNHLCVSSGAKILVAPLAGGYEREAIRPHVLGRFEDMVLASARHPAMLTYLDNFQSIGPGSPGAQIGARASGQRRGLNENYARELLELHTLGVDGGYSQQDVQELAKILTGWTVAGLGRPADGLAQAMSAQGARRGRASAASTAGTPLTFAFRQALHEPGSKSVLGQKYAEAGAAEGERAIRGLCRHRSTARFVATKLVAHFVADTPPTPAVERVARAFMVSDGDLKVVARALIEEPEAWRDEARKFRTPQDWLVAVMRACDLRDVGASTTNLLRQLRHPLWSPSSPKGFGDTLLDWADPDSLLNRGELARSISRLPAAHLMDPRELMALVDVPEGDPLRAMVADTTIPVADRIALTIAGPAFQWR